MLHTRAQCRHWLHISHQGPHACCAKPNRDTVCEQALAAPGLMRVCCVRPNLLSPMLSSCCCRCHCCCHYCCRTLQPAASSSGASPHALPLPLLLEWLLTPPHPAPLILLPAVALPRRMRCRCTACRWGRTSPRRASCGTPRWPRARCRTCCCSSAGVKGSVAQGRRTGHSSGKQCNSYCLGHCICCCCTAGVRGASQKIPAADAAGAEIAHMHGMLRSGSCGC